MKMVRKLFYILLTVLLAGCGGEKTPVRIDSAFGIVFGSKAGRPAEKYIVPVRWEGVDGMAEISASIQTSTIWQAAFVIAESAPQLPEKLIFNAWGVKISGKIELAASRISIAPAYDYGPRAVRITVTDLAAEQLAVAEARVPENRTRRRERAARETVILLEEALERFMTDNGCYPRVLDELHKNILMRPRWNGVYFESIPLDPWGRNYYYRCSADGKSYELFSRGENGSGKLR